MQLVICKVLDPTFFCFIFIPYRVHPLFSAICHVTVVMILGQFFREFEFPRNSFSSLYFPLFSTLGVFVSQPRMFHAARTKANNALIERRTEHVKPTHTDGNSSGNENT